jgi:hypothetical protein
MWTAFLGSFVVLVIAVLALAVLDLVFLGGVGFEWLGRIVLLVHGAIFVGFFLFLFGSVLNAAKTRE